MRRATALRLGVVSMLTLATLFAATPAQEWTIMLRRAGPVRYGTTIAQAQRVAGGQFDRVNPMECGYGHTPGMPPGLRLMLERGRIVRADVDSAGIRTGSGAEVGMTEQEVLALYPGRLQTQPHKYTGPEGHYLIYVPVDPADTEYRLIFETDGRVVTRYRSGLRPAVEYAEGCS